jgi:hypothetical protein
MKLVQASLISVSVALSSFSALTWADTPTEGTKEFTLSGAGSSDKEFDNNAFALDASFGHYLSSASEIGIRQSVGVSDSEGSDSQWNGSTRFFYDYHFGEGKLRPFLGLNIGYIYGESVEETFIAGPEVGLKYYVLPTTFITAQVEYQFLFESAHDADSRFDDGAFAYGVGIGFNF